MKWNRKDDVISCCFGLGKTCSWSGYKKNLMIKEVVVVLCKLAKYFIRLKVWDFENEKWILRPFENCLNGEIYKGKWVPNSPHEGRWMLD